MSKPKNPEPKTILIYHRTGVDLLWLGYCGPEQGAEIPAEQAEAWLRDNPKDWSRRPFAAKEILTDE